MSIAARFLCALALCGLLAACAHRVAQRQAPPPPAVQVSTAAVRTVRPVLDLSGLIAPYQNVALSSDLTEPADEVLVSEGDQVRRGQVLARLDTADLQANLEAAERNAASAVARTVQTQYQGSLSIAQGNNQVTSAEAAVAQAQHNLAYDTGLLDSDEQLLQRGYIAQQQVNQQQTQVRNDQQALNNARAQLASAQANAQTNGTPQRGLQAANIAAARAGAEQAKSQAEQIRVQIAKATIISPIDGIVVNRNLNPGEYPGTRQIFTIQEIDHVYAVLSAFSGQIAELRQGASVSVTSNVLPGKSFTGRVVALLSPTTPNSSGFAVKVDIANPGEILRPGMAVLGRVSEQPLRGITVPSTAFLDDNDDSIMVVQNSVAKTVRVAMRANDGHYAVVAGLARASQVVTDGSVGLSDGERVVLR